MSEKNMSEVDKIMEAVVDLDVNELENLFLRVVAICISTNSPGLSVSSLVELVKAPQ